MKRKTNPAFQKEENGSNLEENIVGEKGREGGARGGGHTNLHFPWVPSQGGPVVKSINVHHLC